MHPLRSFSWILCAVLAGLAWLGISGASSMAQCGCCQHAPDAHAGHQSPSGEHALHAAPHNQASDSVAPAILRHPPHGGQVTVAESVYFVEVVYQPREIRVYLYDPSQEPFSTQSIQGQIAFQTKDAKRQTLPLKYAAAPDANQEQDYLVAVVDTARLRSETQSLSFTLEKLPYRQRPRASFTQTFSPASASPKVAVVATGDADQAAIAKQKTCPVTGLELGSMGTPVKLLVGDKSLYLCCQGCVGKVKAHPENYITRATEAR